VTLDDNLTWKSQIAHVETKVSRNISILNKAKYLLDYKALRMLYCSLILPFCIYCIEVWGNTYMSNIKPLSILQKRAVRIIHNADSREHTNRQFFKSGLLKLKDIAELQTLLVMHSAKSRMLPVYLQQLFVFGSDKEDHRKTFNCKHPYARTTLKQMCISVVGVKLWNSQQKDLKNCMCIFQLKVPCHGHFY